MATRGKTLILTVEDEPDQAKLIKSLLELKIPAQVDVAPNAAAARRLFSSKRYDLVTLDYQLQDVSGLDLLGEICALDDPPPVIMVTGHGDEQVAANALSMGAFSYVVKDKRLNILLVDAVNKALAHVTREEPGGNLFARRTLLGSAFDAVTDFIVIVDLDGKLIYWNDALKRLTRFTDDDLASMKITDGRSGKDLEAAVSWMKKVLDGEEVSNHGIDLIARNGTRTACEFSGALLRDAKDYPVAICGIGRDVRERRLLEEDLRRSEQRYRAIVEDQTELICRLTADTLEFTFLNEALCEYFGITADRLLGDSLLNFLPGEEGIRMTHYIKQVVAGRRSMDIEEKVVLYDGTARWQRWSVSPIIDSDGNVIEVQSVGRDITAQKEAEDALRKSQEASEAAFRNAPNIFALTAVPSGELVDVNDAFLEAINMRREDVIGRTVVELGIPIKPRSRNDLMRELKEKGGLFNFEADYITADGETKSVLASMMRMEAGDAQYILTSAIDITARKKAEEALVQSEEQFRALVENSHDIVAVVSPEGVIQFISPSVERILGFAPSEIVGRSAFEFSHPDAAPDAVAVHMHALEYPGSTLQRELKLRRKDGSWCDVDTLGSALVANSGDVVGTLLNCRDISDRKKAEEIMRLEAARAEILAGISEEFARAGLDCSKTIDVLASSLAEHIGDVCVVLLVSEDGEYLEVAAIGHNDPEVRAFALRHSLDGRWKIGGGVFSQVLETRMPVSNDTFSRGQLPEWAVERLAPYVERYGINSSTIIPLRIEERAIGTLLLSRDAPGNPYTERDVALLQDLADRAAMAIEMARLHERVQEELEARMEREKELLAANVELRGFSHTVSHDLKGPIATMKVNMELLRQRSAQLSERESDEMMESMLRNISKCYMLIEDLLALAESGQTPHVLEDVDVSEVVKRVLDDNKAELEARGAVVNVTGPLGAIRADKTHIYQVFSNLILNSARHNRGDSLQIEVSLLDRPEEGGHRYLIRDNGDGIPEDLLENVLEPFVKGSSGGTGIGLAIVDKIIKGYSGTIQAYNDNGACFEFNIKDYMGPA